MAAPHRNEGSSADQSPAAWSGETREAALQQLERILASSHFRTSKRCSAFLRYVVEHASANDFDRLKERTLGVAVFERPPDYDSNQDPVVRIAAGEVRKRLAQYYQEPGNASEPRITLPAGSYVPALQFIDAAPPLTRVLEPPPVLKPPPARRPLGRYALWGGAGVALALAGVMLTQVMPGRQTDLDRFWAPVFAAEGPVLVCIGQPKAYFFRTQTQAELDKWFSGSTEGKTPPRAIQSVPLSEVFPVWNRSISLSDATAFSRLANYFGKSGKEAALRGGRSVSLTDLRGRPVVLIGAFNNDWTLSLTGELRFYFDDKQNGRNLVRDRQNLSKVDWSVPDWWPDGKIEKDFAIVTRVKDPTTEQVVLTAAGITSAGTEAAGEFLTNPGYFAETLRGAPADWQRKNMQVVLSAQVVSGATGPPKVVAVHFW